MRKSEVNRKTSETEIKLSLNIDGSGVSEISTGVGFFDHMLTLFSRHGLFDISLSCHGDLHVDAHHTVEDVGICLGEAFSRALGERRGLVRYGDAIVPMDDALVMASLDISGRGGLYWEMPSIVGGVFDGELAREFMTAFSRAGGITVHLRLISGHNTHHILECLFKSFTRALSVAVSIDPRVGDAVPSTKGTLV